MLSLLTRRFAALLATVAALAVMPATHAQAADAWPSKTITLISPYAPGGPTDILARLLAPYLQTALGQTVIVENRAGAGGNIGTDYVAKAKPDGYTFLVSSSGPIMIAGALYPHLNYNPKTDFTNIAPLIHTGYVIAVNPKSGLNSIQDIIARADKLSFASAGSGTPQHIIGEMFNMANKIKIQHIPYKGSGPAVTALLAGDVPMSVENPAALISYLKAGSIKALAITSIQRASALPNVPTLDELGMKGFDAQAWYGFHGPAKLPAAITNRMNAEIEKILDMPEVKEKLASLSVDSMKMSPREFDDFVQKDIVKWNAAVKASGATVD